MIYDVSGKALRLALRFASVSMQLNDLHGVLVCFTRSHMSVFVSLVLPDTIDFGFWTRGSSLGFAWTRRAERVVEIKKRACC